MVTTELMADVWRLLMILAGTLLVVVIAYSGYMILVCVSSHIGVGTVEQDDSDVYFVVCRVCCLTSGGSASKAGAIRKWNKRID